MPQEEETIMGAAAEDLAAATTETPIKVLDATYQCSIFSPSLHYELEDESSDQVCARGC